VLGLIVASGAVGLAIVCELDDVARLASPARARQFVITGQPVLDLGGARVNRERVRARPTSPTALLLP
jgi:hypothetical protein